MATTAITYADNLIPIISYTNKVGATTRNMRSWFESINVAPSLDYIIRNNSENYTKGTIKMFDRIDNGLNDLLTINHPDYIYEGALPEYEDEMDYVDYSIKAVKVG